MLDGVELIGTGLMRTDVGQAGDRGARHRHPAGRESSNTLSRARAKVSMRLAPGGDPRRSRR